MDRLEFRKAAYGVHSVYVPTIDEPMSITIIKSGWEGEYHVIEEHGDSEEVHNHFLTAPQIKLKFGIELEDSKTPHDVLVRAVEIKKTPNDQELGAKIRERSYGTEASL